MALAAEAPATSISVIGATSDVPIPKLFRIPGSSKCLVVLRSRASVP
jgi:hypothetical protein